MGIQIKISAQGKGKRKRMELYGDDMIMLVIGAGGDDDGDCDDARGSIGWKGSISGVLWILDPPYSLKIVVVPCSRQRGIFGVSHFLFEVVLVGRSVTDYNVHHHHHQTHHL